MKFRTEMDALNQAWAEATEGLVCYVETFWFTDLEGVEVFLKYNGYPVRDGKSGNFYQDFLSCAKKDGALVARKVNNGYCVTLRTWVSK